MYAFVPGALVWITMSFVEPDDSMEWAQQTSTLQKRIDQLEANVHTPTPAVNSTEHRSDAPLPEALQQQIRELEARLAQLEHAKAVVPVEAKDSVTQTAEENAR